MKRNKLKILLLQIRQNNQIRLEEHESFARHSNLEINQIDIINVFDDIDFDFNIANSYDAIFVGGASEASVLQPEEYKFVPHCIEFLKYLIQIKKPVFASCFGYQLAVLALEGEIVHDSDNYEMGTYQIELTIEALSDPLLGSVETNFWGVSVHKEKATILPRQCQLLGFTKDSTHIFKVKDAPFWAFQFHPELDKECLSIRLRAFKEKYTQDSNHLDSVINSIVETPIANNLPNLFIENIVIPQIK